jgi:Ca-activated chloride channel family protein
MVEVASMKFLAPQWLWGLLVVPVIFVWILFDEKRRQEQFARFVDRKLWSWIAPEMDPAQRVRKAKFLLAACFFILIALARPQFGTHEETVQVSGLDIMLVLDVSNSMEVEDVVPSRLKKAKHFIHSLVNRLNGDRVGIVAFAGSAYLACPLTTDLTYLWDTVQILSPKSIQSQGTDISVGLETALKGLDRGAEETGKRSEAGAQPSRVIILISDGEEQQDHAFKLAEEIKKGGASLYVVGVGTPEGGPIPVRDENGGGTTFKRDRNGQPIVSRFKPDELMKVAHAGGGKYFSVTDSEGEIETLLRDLGALNRTDYAERRYLVYEERFQIPLAIAIVLLFFEISIPARKILVLLILFWSPWVRAESSFKNPASLDAYLENRNGIKAYQEGKLDEAQKSFGAAQARDPKRPELEYNQGIVSLDRGEVDQAIHEFKSSAQSAFDKNDQDLLGKSLYNLGNAYTKKGDVKGAVQSYARAINSAIQSKNTDLEAKARKNMQLALQEIKQQQQQKQQQEQQQKEKQQKDQQQQKDQNQTDKQQQNQQQQKQEKQQGQKEESDSTQGQKQKDDKKFDNEYQKGSKKRQFKSEKMAPEDAERVMTELKSRERELQEKLNRQNGKYQANPKDW